VSSTRCCKRLPRALLELICVRVVQGIRTSTEQPSTCRGEAHGRNDGKLAKLSSGTVRARMRRAFNAHLIGRGVAVTMHAHARMHAGALRACAAAARRSARARTRTPGPGGGGRGVCTRGERAFITIHWCTCMFAALEHAALPDHPSSSVGLMVEGSNSSGTTLQSTPVTSSTSLPVGQLATHCFATWSAYGVPPLHASQSLSLFGT